MSDDAQVLSQLSDYLHALPTHAPEHVLRSALATVATTHQRRPWLPYVALPVADWRISRAAVVAFTAFASVAVLIVLAQIFSRLPTNLPPATQPVVATSAPTAPPVASPVPPSTRSSAGRFEKPFTYQVPDGLSVVVNRLEPKLVALSSRTAIDGPEHTFPPQDDLYPYLSSGIVIASTTGAQMDSCPRHLGGPVIKDGDDVASLMKDEAGFTFTTTPATVGALPAVVTSAISATCLGHFHVDSGNEMDGNRTMLLGWSTEKVYFVLVGDTTVLIQIWGSNDWFPIADQIVQSIRFTDEQPSTPTATTP